MPQQRQTLPGMTQTQTIVAEANKTESSMACYRVPPSSFDEFLNPDRTMRPVWQAFGERLTQMGASGINQSWKRGEELLRENGISYNLLSEQDQAQRPWNLDPLPALISETEWNELSSAVIQRANLWNAILKDCYGPRNLLAKGLLPPALLFMQPNFNRFLPEPSAKQPFLTSYAVDVARSPDGTWTVVADRTEAPNGTGFALENRIILSNVFPETSNKLRLIRLASFFQSMRNTLFAHAPAGLDEPRIVMLSPGPGDRTYFEDAYLARYLGITLAVGEEMTVRNDRLYLKTVSGLQRVHVIYRRVHETAIDPLEDPTGSAQGVPGLMRAMRAGTVVVINPPGTGIAESPALLPYLPAIARDILGEDLKIPSVETVWGGDSEDLISDLPGQAALLKEAFGRRKNPPIPLDTLPPIQRQKLAERVRADPSAFVLQRQMDFSSGPVWTGSQIESRPLAFRLFLFANAEGSYEVMPGGLVRCAATSDALPGLSLAHDSGSKDLWVLSDKEAHLPHQSNQQVQLSIRRSTGPLSSRSADNLFWIGRYAERTESVTRILLETVISLTADLEPSTVPPIKPLLETLREFGYLSQEAADKIGPRPVRREVLELLSPIFFEDLAAQVTGGNDSIPQNVKHLFRLASLSRDRLSSESWRIIRAHDSLVQTQPPQTLVSLRPILQKSLLNHSAFNGTCRENITRTQGWLFLNIGRRVERINWLLTLISNLGEAEPEFPPNVLETALSINDTTLTYRFRYRGSPQPLPALDLILFDASNPRSLAFQLSELDRDLKALPGTEQAGITRPAHRIILRALHYLQTELLSTDESTTQEDELEKLMTFVNSFRGELPRFTEQIGWEFFSHVGFTAS